MCDRVGVCGESKISEREREIERERWKKRERCMTEREREREREREHALTIHPYDEYACLFVISFTS